MTRNVQSIATTAIRNMLVAAGSWLVASLAVADDFPTFDYHEIARVGNHMGQTSLVDVDKDGDLDICSKAWNGDLHIYLRNMLVEHGGKAMKQQASP